MWHLFQELFEANSPAPARGRTRPRLESLESRNLLNAGPISGPFLGGGPAHFGPPAGGAMPMGVGHGPSSSGALLTAALTGATGTAGSATFTTGSTAGQNNLGLKVSGLASDTTFNVTAGTTSLGGITTDAKGNGSFILNDLTATIAAGTALTLTDPSNATVLSGTFAAGASCPTPPRPPRASPPL